MVSGVLISLLCMNAILDLVETIEGTVILTLPLSMDSPVLCRLSKTYTNVGSVLNPATKFYPNLIIQIMFSLSRIFNKSLFVFSPSKDQVNGRSITD